MREGAGAPRGALVRGALVQGASRPGRAPDAAPAAARTGPDLLHDLPGYTMREIARYLGIHYATVSRRIRRHEAQVLKRKT